MDTKISAMNGAFLFKMISFDREYLTELSLGFYECATLWDTIHPIL